MMSWTGMQSLYQELINNTNPDSLTTGKLYMNLFYKNIVNKEPWDFTEKLFTNTTVALQQNYALPNDYRKLNNVAVQVGAIRYVAKEVTTRAFWDKLNQVSFKSNFVQWFYIYEGQIYLWPIPSTAGYPIYIDYKVNAKDLSAEDYTTGTITTLTNGSTAVVGFGSTWTSSMAGRYIQFDETTGGDGEWYKITSVDSATTITLSKNYMGTSLVAGSATYKIGQMSIIPDGYQELSVYAACKAYSIQKDPEKVPLFENLYSTLYAQFKIDRSNKTTSPIIQDNSIPIINPNLTITV